MKSLLPVVALWGICLCTFGCGESPAPKESGSAAASKDNAPPSVEHLLSTPPEKSVEVADAREESEDDAEIVVRGRVGGEPKPFVDGLAAFSIVDTKLKPCEEDGCETPWDYCCSPELASHKALVKVVDEQGKVVGRDARKLLGIKELSTIVVHGRTKRDDAGNLTVIADKIYVEE